MLVWANEFKTFEVFLSFHLPVDFQLDCTSVTGFGVWLLAKRNIAPISRADDKIYQT